jgi:hypothetical protein
MEATVVLIACGRHDRGRLFPRTRRQIDNLKEPLQKLIGELDSGEYLVFHDGTNQAQETAERIGFSFHSAEGERDFLGCTAHVLPDEYELRKAFRLVEEAQQKRVIFVADQAYLSLFARFYLARLQKDNAAPGISQGDAVVIETDGTLHLVSPPD